MAVTLPAGIRELLSAKRANLSQRKATSQKRFDQMAGRLQFTVDNPPLFSSLNSDPAADAGQQVLPDRAKQQATGVTEILTKLGIGNMHITNPPTQQERYAVASVQAATLPLTPAQAKESELTPT